MINKGFLRVDIMNGEKLEIKVGNKLLMKKPHPCGNDTFLVTRIGMDFKLRCEKCGHEVIAPRAKIEKQIKKIF